jgi:hypothetical protein
MLFLELNIPTSQLIFTNYDTGAGYIIAGADNVIVRWGSYHEAINVLNKFLGLVKKEESDDNTG